MAHGADLPRRPGRPLGSGVVRCIAVAVILLGLVLNAAAGAVAGASPPPQDQPEGYAPRFSRIFVLVIENQSFDDIFTRNVGAHFILDELTPAAALATQFYAPKRNSPTTYFAMSSGYTYTEGDHGHWAGKCEPSPTCTTMDRTVYEQMTDSGRTWRIYSEDQTEPCQTTYGDKYWVGHNPAVFFSPLGPNSYTKTGDGSCGRNDLPLYASGADVANGAIPDYALIVPNNCNNMHDACPPIRDRVLQGDTWLRDTLAGDRLVPGGLLPWVQANDTLLVITYDEARLASDREGCCPYTPKRGGGHIPTWIIGPVGKVEPGARSEVQLSNFSILRTVEENWDFELLGHAGDDATAGLDSLMIPTASRQPVVPAGAAPIARPVALATAASGAISAASGAVPAASGAPVMPPKAAPAPFGGMIGAASGLAVTFVLLVLPIGGALLFIRRQSDAENAEEDERDAAESPFMTGRLYDPQCGGTMHESHC